MTRPHHDPDASTDADITALLDEVHGSDADGLDPPLRRAQARSLGRDGWDDDIG